MKKNSTKKKFDAVALMRKSRDQISSETQDMTYEEFRRYISSKLQIARSKAATSK